MAYNLSDTITFGQYKGLTIQQIYQGTNEINSDLIKGYLDFVLNKPEYIDLGFLEMDFIEKFIVSHKTIKVVGGVDDPEKPLSDTNRLVFNNIQNQLQGYLNIHFSKKFPGIVDDLKAYNRKMQTKYNLDGDPEYLTWCIRNVDSFCIEPEGLAALQALEVIRFSGMKITHSGNSTYDYSPDITLETYAFTEEIIDLNLIKYKANAPRRMHNTFREKPTFNKYEGTYAQSEARLSDQFIDDAFGGEPDAYWNID